MVKLGTGTLPQLVAQSAAPPGSELMSSAASGADSVSFQSLAGRSTSPFESVTTSPCCCAATAIASTCFVSGTPAWAQALLKAPSQSAGRCSLRGGDVGG